MIQDLFFTETVKRKVNVVPNKGSNGANYTIVVEGKASNPTDSDSVQPLSGDRYEITGGVSEGNRDRFVIEGEVVSVEGDVSIETTKVVETERSLALGYIGAMGAALIVLVSWLQSMR